jgi:pimeloyl-ACP methyl ester carboxylesterase
MTFARGLLQYTGMNEPLITEAKCRISSKWINFQRAGKENDPTILLLHGLGTRASFWLPVMPALVGEGYQVLALDLPGFGNSDPLEELFRPYHVAKRIMGFTQALDLEQVIVVGHSMGGTIACGCAVVDPTRIKALVLVDAFGINDSWMPISLGNLFGLILPSIYYRFTWQFDRLIQSILENNFHVPERLSPAILDRAIAENWTGHTHGLKAVFGLGVSIGFKTQRREFIIRLRERFLQHRFPILVIWGEQDRLIPVRSVLRFKSEMPEIDMNIISDCGHMPSLEKTEEFNQSIFQFINVAGF